MTGAEYANVVAAYIANRFSGRASGLSRSTARKSIIGKTARRHLLRLQKSNKAFASSAVSGQPGTVDRRFPTRSTTSIAADGGLHCYAGRGFSDGVCTCSARRRMRRSAAAAEPVRFDPGHEGARPPARRALRVVGRTDREQEADTAVCDNIRQRHMSDRSTAARLSRRRPRSAAKARSQEAEREPARLPRAASHRMDRRHHMPGFRHVVRCANCGHVVQDAMGPRLAARGAAPTFTPARSASRSIRQPLRVHADDRRARVSEERGKHLHLLLAAQHLRARDDRAKNRQRAEKHSRLFKF